MLPPQVGGDLSNLLGAGLGGLAQYGMQEFQKPGKIDQFKQLGFSEGEAQALVNLPPVQQSQFIKEKMKQGEQQQKLAALGLIGGQQQIQAPAQQIVQGVETFQPQQEPSAAAISEPDQTAQDKEALKENIKLLSPDEQRQILYSGLFNTQEIAQFERVIAQGEKQKLAEKTFSQKEQSQRQRLEMPQRNQLVKDVAEIQKEGRLAVRKIADFKSLKAATRDPQLRTGAFKQALDLFGMGDLFQAPIDFVAEKIVGDINLASLSSLTTPGKATAQLLKEVAKVNPTLFSQPEGIEAMSDLKIYAEKIKKRVSSEIDKIRDKARDNILPLNAISKAYENAKPFIKQMHQKEYNVVKKLSEIKPEEIKVGSIVQSFPKGRHGRAIDRETGETVEF